MKIINRHYNDVARQLKLTPEDVANETNALDVKKHVIVLVESLSKSSLKAINYARQLSEDKNIIAFNVSIDKESSVSIREKWEEYNIPIPLIVKYSPYREIIGPLIKYIESEEHQSSPGSIVTVVMPQFVVSRVWKNILHNQTAYAIRQKLLHDRHIAIITVPFVLDKER